MSESESKVIFEDTMKENWQNNWFLDGKKAIVEHRNGGIDFITTASKVDKRVDRAAFDAQHAVLWTKKEFEGDIRISYTFTKLKDCSWQKLIYIQAQGIGKNPYVEDIHAWRDRRNVAAMSQYFNYINLIGLSFRDEIRCKRYPWSDVEQDIKLESEFLPRGPNKGMEIGRKYHVLVEKRKKSIALRVTDLESDKYVVNHTWDLTNEEVINNRKPKFVEKGRIGLRHMGGFRANYKNFRVEQL